MSKIQRIEIDFPTAVSLPDGFEKTLDALIGMVCEQYERENPARVMWPAGCGSKPLWREPEEPEYDDTVYFIEVAEREDLHGRNQHNPDRDRLRAEVLARRKTKKTQGKNYFAEDGTLMNADGTRSIFDDVDQ